VVLRQDHSLKSLDPGLLGGLGQVGQEDRADPQSLHLLGDGERDLGAPVAQ
jgi:hypothetical protein